MHICLLSNGYYGYNNFNIYDKDNDNDNERIKKIYILFINEKNHFNYSETNLDENKDKDEFNKEILSLINNNLLEWKQIRKSDNRLSLNQYHDIYKEMYDFYKYKIIRIQHNF